MASIPHRLSACHRHPALPITGFCASCLRERLAGFHSSPSPDHRHTTSFSSNGDAPESSRRRSCEVRPRSSLSDLFGLDDRRRGRNRKPEIGEAVRVRDEADEETKTMKEFIDLELKIRKKNAGRDLRSFRDAAFALGEKLRKWKRKHRSNQNRNGNGNGNGRVEKQRKERRLRETQSEIGEYGLGRRSCDSDPRFSMDWPRASWDGCLIGKACSCQCPCSRLSPVEDANDRVMVEEISDNVNRRESMGEVVEELKPISNAKVSPTTAEELFHGAKLLVNEKELSLRDSAIGSASDVASGVRVRGKGFNKWGIVWNKLGLVQRKEDDKMGEGEGECVVGDLVNEPPQLRRVVNVRRGSESVSQKLSRSYSLSCRLAGSGLVNGLGDTETKGSVLNGRQDLVLHRNRSVGYSPNSL